TGGGSSRSPEARGRVGPGLRRWGPPARRSAEAMMAGSDGFDLLLSGGSVVTMDEGRRVLEPGAVGIRGERIAFVGSPAAVPGGARREIDCTGKAVLPGFVDCHTHLFQGLARGIGDGMSLWPWLCDFLWPY